MIPLYKKLEQVVFGKNKTKIAILATLTLLLIIVVSLPASSIFLSLVLLYIFSQHFLGRLFDSKLFRIIVICFVYILILQSTILASWLVDKELPLNLSVYVVLGLLLISSIWWRFLALHPKIHLAASSNKQDKNETLKSLNTKDLYAILTCLLIFVVVAITPLAHGNNPLSGGLLNIINGGVDDSAHIAKVNDHLQFNRGILYHTEEAGQLRAQSSISSYPAGWSAANASIIRALSPNLQTGIDSLKFYVATKIFWYMVLVYLFARVSLSIFDMFRTKTKTYSPWLWLFLSTSLFSYFFLIDPFLEGFYNFIPQLSVVLILSLVLAQVNESRLNKHPALQNSLILLAVLGISGALSWLLVLPAILFAILLSLFDVFSTNRNKEFLKDILKSVVLFMPLFLVLILSLLAQLYISSTGDHAVTFVSGVLIGGGIGIFSPSFYLCILVGAVICLALFNRNSTTQMKAILNLALSLILFASVIYFIQLYYLDRNSYYYFKTLDTFLVLAIPVAIVGYGLLLERLERSVGRSISFMCTLLAALLIAQFVGLNSTRYPSEIEPVDYIAGRRHTTPEVNNYIVDTLATEGSQRNYFDKEYTIFYEHGLSVQNYFSTMLTKTNEPESKCFSGALSGLLMNQGIEVVLSSIADSCPSGYRIVIATNSASVTSFRAIIMQKGLQHQVTVEAY